MKEKILKILSEDLKNREGIENFLYYLENGTDFFTAPCSTIFHLNGEGGLAKHSLNVYTLLKEKVERHGLKTPPDTIAICGLLHDLSKTNFYVKGKKWKKENGKWVQIDCYEVEDQFPASHGSKSVFILQRFLKLTDEEILAIQWHMGPFQQSVGFNYPDGYAYKNAREKYPLVTLLFTADFESSDVLEKQ